MPSAFGDLVALASQPIDAIKIPQVVALVESEPAVAARLLRLANSAFFGARRQIETLPEAIVRIGLTETMDVTRLSLLSDRVPKLPSFPGFSADQFWVHSWICATSASVLGRPHYLTQPSCGALHLAGLVHDIGKAVLAIWAREEFEACLARARNERRLLAEVELEAVGMDHAMVGAYILSAWDLPVSICEAVACHHHPDGALPEHREFASLTQFSDVLANRLQMQGDETPAFYELENTWLLRHGGKVWSSPERLQALLAETEEAVQSKSQLLKYTIDLPEGE